MSILFKLLCEENLEVVVEKCLDFIFLEYAHDPVLSTNFLLTLLDCCRQFVTDKRWLLTTVLSILHFFNPLSLELNESLNEATETISTIMTTETASTLIATTSSNSPSIVEKCFNLLDETLHSSDCALADKVHAISKCFYYWDSMCRGSNGFQCVLLWISGLWWNLSSDSLTTAKMMDKLSEVLPLLSKRFCFPYLIEFRWSRAADVDTSNVFGDRTIYWGDGGCSAFTASILRLFVSGECKGSGV